MEEALKIVQGNDFYLTIPVRRILFGNDEYGDETIMHERMFLNECSVLSVCLIGDDTERVQLKYTISEDDDSLIIAKVPGDKISCGWYGIEVKGTYMGRRFRSYEKRSFKIVENNAKGYATGKMCSGEGSYQVDTMWMLYACPSYAHLYINLEDMTLRQKGTVEGGKLYLNDNGRLCMSVR